MPSAHPSIGFQAVVLCGPGTSLYPFTGAEDLPKALLPIANKPMLHYPLEWCEKAGFESILILTLSEHHTAIQSYMRSHRLQKSSIYIQVEPASSLNDNLGTADVLRIAYRKGWIKRDFAVLPCDLVTNLDAQEVAQLWMVEQAGFDGDMGQRSRRSQKGGDGDEGRRGGLGVWYETRGEGAVKGQETDFLAVDGAVKGEDTAGSVTQLLFTLPGDSLRGGGENASIELRGGLLRKHPNLQLLATRRDSGIYFFPYWVLKFIDRNPKLNSIREDVLPWWSKACWQNQRLARKLGLLEILEGSAEGGDDDSEDGSGERYQVGSMSSTRRRSFSSKMSEAERVFASRVPTTSGEAAAIATASLQGKKNGNVQIPSITAYLPSAATGFTRRVDTVHLYLFASLYLAKSDPSVPSTMIKIDPSSSIDPKAKVTSFDCLIADKVSIGERALIKRSVLGSGVSIGKNVRLTGCVLMDGASVGEGAKLEGCTIGRKAIVGVKANLKDCEVAEGYVVEEGAEAKNERFVAFTGLDGNYASDASGLGSDGEYDDDDDEEEEGNDAPRGKDADEEDEEEEVEEEEEEEEEVEEEEEEVEEEEESAKEKKTLPTGPKVTPTAPAPPLPTSIATPAPAKVAGAKAVDIVEAAEIVKATESTADS